MKLVTLIALGLLASAGFMWRELRRAPLMPPDYDADGPWVNESQAGGKQDSSVEEDTAVVRARLLERLRREEQRQRPQEGRN